MSLVKLVNSLATFKGYSLTSYSSVLRQTIQKCQIFYVKGDHDQYHLILQTEFPNVTDIADISVSKLTVWGKILVLTQKFVKLYSI